MGWNLHGKIPNKTNINKDIPLFEEVPKKLKVNFDKVFPYSKKKFNMDLNEDSMFGKLGL